MIGADEVAELPPHECSPDIIAKNSGCKADDFDVLIADHGCVVTFGNDECCDGFEVREAKAGHARVTCSKGCSDKPGKLEGSAISKK